MKVSFSTGLRRFYNKIANNHNPYLDQPKLGLRQQYKFARNHAFLHQGMTIIPTLIAIYGAVTNQLKVLLIGGAGGAVVNRVARSYQKEAATIKSLLEYQKISQRAVRIFGKKHKV